MIITIGCYKGFKGKQSIINDIYSYPSYLLSIFISNSVINPQRRFKFGFPKISIFPHEQHSLLYVTNENYCHYNVKKTQKPRESLRTIKIIIYKIIKLKKKSLNKKII